MADASFPSSSPDDVKKHVMDVFEEATKDCEDKVLNEIFDSIRDYDSLNKYAVEIFNLLANDTLVEEAKELFTPRSESAVLVLPDVAVFTIVILAYANAGNTEAVLKVYHQMIANGVTPTSCTYTILITSLATNLSSDVTFVSYARKYFLEMLDKGMKPHSASCKSLYDAIACCESVEKAGDFLEQIQGKGFVPESEKYRFEEKRLKKVMKGLKMYEDLIKKTTDKDVRKVIYKWCNVPGLAKKDTMKMFSALIHDGNGNEAYKLYKYFCETGVYPIVLVYTSVIQAYLKFGKNKGAMEAYRDMLASGVAPNSYTYTVLIKGLTLDTSSYGDAKICMLEMMERGIRPNAATYTAVIEGFARQEEMAAEEEAKDLVEVMMSKGFVPNAKDMMVVLKGRPTPLIRRVIDIVLSKLKGR